ncbi:MAG: DoxX family protein [Pseudomonadota bacterium]
MTLISSALSSGRSAHDSFFKKLTGLVEKCSAGLVARIVFLSVLFFYFIKSALTKIDGFWPNASAYAQILPHRAAEYEYVISRFEPYHHFIVYLGTYGEFILPVLVVIGLFGRVASLGMIIFIAVQSVVDIWGHFVDGGLPFDKVTTGIIADQRLMWVFILMVIVVRGSGALSVDRWLGERSHKTPV